MKTITVHGICFGLGITYWSTRILSTSELKLDMVARLLETNRTNSIIVTNNYCMVPTVITNIRYENKFTLESVEQLFDNELKNVIFFESSNVKLSEINIKKDGPILLEMSDSTVIAAYSTFSLVPHFETKLYDKLYNTSIYVTYEPKFPFYIGKLFQREIKLKWAGNCPGKNERLERQVEDRRL